MGQAYLLLVLVAVVVTLVLWQPTAADTHSPQHQHMYSPRHGDRLPQEVLDQIGDAIKDATTYASLHGLSPNVSRTGCDCRGISKDCGCCIHINLPKIRIHTTVCTNITYVPERKEIQVGIYMNGVVMLSEVFTVKTPAPFCFNIPYLKWAASACLDIYNINTSSTKFTACMRLYAKVMSFNIFDFQLGCVNIPLMEKEYWRRNVESVEFLEDQRAFARNYNQNRYMKMMLMKLA